MAQVPVRPEGRRERRRAHTRAALLHAAKSLIDEVGLHSMRVEDITERADVGKGVFYNYFTTKEGLIAALVEEGVDLLEREYLRRVGDEPELAKRVEALTGALEVFYQDHPEYALLFHQARGLLQLKGTGAVSLRQAFAAYLSRLSALLPGKGDAGTWSSDDLLDVAAAMAGAAAGYRSFCIAAERPVNVTTIRRALMAGIPQTLEDRRTSSPRRQ